MLEENDLQEEVEGVVEAEQSTRALVNVINATRWAFLKAE